MITIEREKLSSALSLVSRTVSRKANDLQVMRGVKVTSKKNTATFAATDGIVGVVVKKVPVRADEEFDCVIANAERLVPFVGASDRQEIVMKMRGTGQVSVKAGSTARFNILPNAEFPLVAAAGEDRLEPKRFSLDAFLGMYLKVGFVVEQGGLAEATKILSGIFYDGDFIASSHQRIVWLKSVEKEKRNKTPVTFPLKLFSVLEAARTYSKGIEEKGTKNRFRIYGLSEGGRMVEFVIGDVLVTSRLLEGEYPASSLRNFIIKSYKKGCGSFLLDREELIRCLSQFSLFSGGGEDMHLGFEISKDSVRLNTSDVRTGESVRRRVKCEIKGLKEGREVILSFNHVTELLPYLSGKKVEFRLSWKDREPVIVKEGNYRYLMMPFLRR